MHEFNSILSENVSTSATLFPFLPSPSLSSPPRLSLSSSTSSSPLTSSLPSLEPFQNITSTILQPSRQWHVFCLFLLVVAGIVGNSLVCVAVCVEKKLQNVTNYFLVSLAIADLLVSLVVMPSCIVQEFVGYWPMGVVLCNTWLVADVTLCTSSIMHMCTISMDRYLGVKFPFKMRNRSKFIVGVKVVLVWIFSLTLASPLVFIGMNNSVEILNSEGQCGIFNPYFLIYGSLVAFFVPFLIMLVTYTLTIRLLKRRAELLKWSETSMVRTSGKKRKRLKSINRSKSKWVSLSTTESSADNETINTFQETNFKNSMLVQNKGSSFIKMSCRIPNEVTSKMDNNVKSSDSEGSLSEDSRSFKRRTKRSLRRVLMEPMIRKKLKSRCLNRKHHELKTQPALNATNFTKSEISVKYSPIFHLKSFKSRDTRKGSTSCREIMKSRTRSFQEINNEGINNSKCHQLITRNSAPSSCSNLASNFSKALPVHFKSGNETNQIKNDVFISARCRQLKNLLRPTLSLDTSSIQYDVYKSSDESEPLEWESRKDQRRSIEDRYRKRSGIPLELSIERNMTHLGNTPTLISRSDKNISSVDSSSLHSFIEKFLVSRETAKHGQMNSVKTEKKAVKVLGAMFCFFFLCWSSFFVMNTFIGICKNCRFSSILFKCFLWLGYSSSIVNPIIYTIFNKAFKQTFQSLLTCSPRCLMSNSYNTNYGCCGCCGTSKKKAVALNATFLHRRSTTTTTTSSSYCRRLSTRKSIAVSEECIDKYHIRTTP